MARHVLLGVAADWQDVIIAALTLAGVIVNAFVSVYIVTRVRVPSGGKIGEVVERTHANSAVAAAAIPTLLQRANGEDDDDDGYDERMERVKRG